MSRAVRLAVDQVIHDLQHRPADFRCTKNELIDAATQLTYWIASGASKAGIWQPYTLNFGWYHGCRFMRALEKWKAVHAIYKSTARADALENQ